LELVLASTSRYRRALLERLGIPFRCRAPRVDEESFKTAGLEPRALTALLARAKILGVREEEPHSIVIGSDQLVACDGRVFGKPGDVAAAVDQLVALSGRSHELITALVVCDEDRAIEHLDVAILHMRALGREEIERYVAADLPLDCAGSYKLEERGIVLFERIESADHTAITGLPLIALTTILRDLGYPLP
jgi:septum formation protein